MSIRYQDCYMEIKPHKTQQNQTKGNQTTKPLHKDASLYCMDNAAEARLVFTAVEHQGPLPGKSGSQPVTDL